jgi:hypothetical protein
MYGCTVSLCAPSYTFYRSDGSFVGHDDDGGDAITLTLDDPVHGAGELTLPAFIRQPIK